MCLHESSSSQNATAVPRTQLCLAPSLSINTSRKRPARASDQHSKANRYGKISASKTSWVLRPPPQSLVTSSGSVVPKQKRPFPRLSTKTAPTEVTEPPAMSEHGSQAPSTNKNNASSSTALISLGGPCTKRSSIHRNANLRSSVKGWQLLRSSAGWPMHRRASLAHLPKIWPSANMSLDLKLSAASLPRLSSSKCFSTSCFSSIRRFSVFPTLKTPLATSLRSKSTPRAPNCSLNCEFLSGSSDRTQPKDLKRKRMAMSALAALSGGETQTKSSKNEDHANAAPLTPSSRSALGILKKDATEAVPPKGSPFMRNSLTRPSSGHHTATQDKEKCSELTPSCLHARFKS